MRPFIGGCDSDNMITFVILLLTLLATQQTWIEHLVSLAKLKTL